MDTKNNTNDNTNSKIELGKFTEEIRRYVKDHVSESRYLHSVRVADTCAKLCEKFGQNAQLGFLAGLAHDMCKATSEEKLLKIASRDGMKISKIERDKPSLLHGRAAAVVLREKWNFTNADVLEAIAHHTFGKEGMCDIAKILYVADKIEPGRPHVDEEYTARLWAMDIDGMTMYVAKENMDYVVGKGKTVSAETKKLYKSLKK